MGKQPSLRVVSDGTGYGTHVFDQTGNEIHYVSKLKFELAADDHYGTLTLEVVNVPVEITIQNPVKITERVIEVIPEAKDDK